MSTPIHNSTTCSCEFCIAANSYEARQERMRQYEQRRQPCLECGFVRYRPDAEYHDYGCSRAPNRRGLVFDGKAVHHIDGDVANNDPSNISDFASISDEWNEAATEAIATSDSNSLNAITRLALLGNALILQANLVGQLGRSK